MNKHAWTLTRLALLLGLAAGATAPRTVAQDAAILEIALRPEIRVSGEVGAIYVIESKSNVEGDFWLTRGWIELTTHSANWLDPMPAASPQRIYRAVKASRPDIQTIADMAWIPPGSFVMGSPETEWERSDGEGPLTQVKLTEGFWLGKHEVTQLEFSSVMGVNPSHFQPPEFPDSQQNSPVEQVSWDQAVAYCQKLTEQESAAGRLASGYAYRLPTEAEWEYACRAGTTTRFSYGEDPACIELGRYAWYEANSLDTTHPVAQKLPNPWGLYDMHGNVQEWCQDWHGLYPGGMVVDPQGPAEGSTRVLRGGDWVYQWGFGGAHCRSAFRGSYYPDSGYSNFGFRVVLARSRP